MSNPFKDKCRCPKVCQLLLFLSERNQAYMTEIHEGSELGVTTIVRMIKEAKKMGLITSRLDDSSGHVRRYFFLTDRGKHQADLIRACNDHLNSK